MGDGGKYGRGLLYIHIVANYYNPKIFGDFMNAVGSFKARGSHVPDRESFFLRMSESSDAGIWWSWFEPLGITLFLVWSMYQITHSISRLWQFHSRSGAFMCCLRCCVVSTLFIMTISLQ